MNTSGRAVLFAGTTVVIALLGMFALGVNLLNGVAIAAALGVVLVLAATITLLPALLRLVGRRIGGTGSARAPNPRRTSPGSGRDGSPQSRGAPCVATVAAAAIMVTLAVPMLGLRLGSSDAGNDPAGQTTRKAYDLIAQGFGKGFNGPLQVAVKLPRRERRGGAHAADRRAPRRRRMWRPWRRLESTPPAMSPRSGSTRAPRRRARRPRTWSRTCATRCCRRSSELPGRPSTSVARPPAEVDFSNVLSSKLPLFIGIVIALSAVLLMVVFRSFLIPLQAAVMNVLSIGAALGIVQAVFERGWVFGIQPGPIDAFIPVMGFAIIFGLSMDYEVFLISRVHEEWQRTGDATSAIREGLGHTGRVITAAAAVMVAVFGAFAISGNRTLELFGVMMASAVFLDAVVIRMIMLPAVLQLLGRRTWKFPLGLDRRLPRLAIEPPSGAQRPPTPALEEAA